MPEDLGTVNLKQGAQTREIELLRRHYRTHRDSLARLIPDAPTEHLASEYQRLISEIDMSVRKLDELEKKPETAAPLPSSTETNPAMKTGPGTRPLVRTSEPAASAYRPLPPSTGAQSRVAMIVIAGVVVLAIIGWLIWRGSSDRKATAPVVEQQPISATNNAPTPAVTPAPVAAATVLKVSPALADYGTIRKGTRAVRQFQVTNLSDGVVEIEVPRSNCRCLYYDYNGKLPARGQETITVTIDGARAKSGPLQEQVEVRTKKNPSISTTVTVQATIR
jgi:hypothetical protein